MGSKKNDIDELIYKTETDSVTENKFMVTKGDTGMEERDTRGPVYTHYYVQNRQQGPAVCTRNYTQCLVITCNGKESKKECHVQLFGNPGT